MAGSGASIPKVMNVIPAWVGVTKYIADSQLVIKATKDVSKAINASLGKVNTSSAASTAALARTGSRIGSFNDRLKSGLSSLKGWAAGFDFTKNRVAAFGSTLSGVARGVARFSSQMDRLGRSLLIGITLPVVALGVAITKTSLDFENALVKVENLVGLNTETVRKWGQEILEVSSRLATSPVELAKGLFAAASGFGSIAAQAPVMDVLVASAMAAAVGLGEIEDIARAATATMNAFADSSITASQAVSLLVLGVREGNLEVDKLATAIGNVLGVASIVSAGADDVLAFISAYTRFGVEPSRAVTALNTALTNLIKPSTKNQEILLKYGLTLDSIKERIAGPSGLAHLFVEMEQNMSEVDFISIFGLRSLRAVAAVTNSVSGFNEEYIRIAKSMQDETGTTFTYLAWLAEEGSQLQKRYIKEAIDAGEQGMNALEESFVRHTQTLQYRFDRIKELITTSFLGIDGAITPFLKDFADQVIEVLENLNVFIRENKETVKVILKFAAALALIGPALLIFSKMVLVFGVLSGAAGALFQTIGIGVGLVVNLGVQFGVLAVRIAGAVATSFLSLAGLIWKAAIAMGALIARFVTFLALQVGVKIAGLGSAFVTLLASIGPVVVALGAIVIAGLAIAGAFTELGKILGSVVDSVRETFTGMNDDAKSWGDGLIKSFSQGIFEGLGYLVDTLNKIGETLAYWLKGLSPPRIAPDIDKWGTATMQEWIDGWALADFSTFSDIGDTIKGFLTSLDATSGERGDGKDIAGTILGIRESVAAAINEMKRLGDISKESLDKIYNAIGVTTLELESFIEATIRAGDASRKLEEAQKRVNAINVKYSRLLDPIQRKMDAINKAKERELEIAKLDQLLASKNVPDDIRELAGLRLQQIELETRRDEELGPAEEALSEAQIANNLAQEDLDLAKAALDLQTSGLNLLGELNKKIDGIKGALDKIEKGVGALGSEPFEPFDSSDIGLNQLNLDGDGEGGIVESITGNIDKKLEELRGKLTETGNTWALTWRLATAKFNLFLANTTLTLARLKLNFFLKFGPLLTTLKTEWGLVWADLKEVFLNFWDDIDDDAEALLLWLQNIGDKTANDAPGVIQAAGQAIRTYLIPALDGLLGVLGNTVFEGDWWTRNFGWLTEPAPVLFDLPAELALDEKPSFSEWFDEVEESWNESLGIFDAFLFTSAASLAPGAVLLSAFTIDFTNSYPEIETAIRTFLTDAVTFVSDNWETIVAAVLTGFFPGAVLVAALADDILASFPSITETLRTAWKNATSPQEESEPLFALPEIGWPEELLKNLSNIPIPNIFELLGAEEAKEAEERIEGIQTGVAGLGTGFFTLGTNTDIARAAVDLLWGQADVLGAKLNILKNGAIASLMVKINDLKVWVDDAKQSIVDLGTEISGNFTSTLDNLWSLLTDTINPVLNDLWDWFEAITLSIAEGVNPIVVAMGEILDTFKTTVLQPLIPVLERAIELLSSAISWWNKLSGALKEWVKRQMGYGNDNDEGDASASTTGGNNGSSVAAAVAAAVGAVAAPVSPSSVGAAAAGATVAGVSLSFGDVNINNEMDMATFEARVVAAVSRSMSP